MVIDSWKFSILLLYILWDDLPISMISSSKEQLQQQLEYTQLKPDYHTWWISKRQSGREHTLGKRYEIKFCFKFWKKCHRNVWNASDCFSTILHESSISFRVIWEIQGRQAVFEDDERCGRGKEARTPGLIGQRVRVRVTILRF